MNEFIFLKFIGEKKKKEEKSEAKLTDGLEVSVQAVNAHLYTCVS